MKKILMAEVAMMLALSTHAFAAHDQVAQQVREHKPALQKQADKHADEHELKSDSAKRIHFCEKHGECNERVASHVVIHHCEVHGKC